MIVSAKAATVQAGDKGPKLIHTELVGQVTAGASTFGPAGPNCDSSAGGSACAFVSEDFTGSANTIPFGRSTSKGTITVLFGVNGTFATPSGPHDSAGSPTGFCAPTFGNDTETYANGALSFNAQGTICCASDSCGQAFLGPPNVGHFSDIITGGTGKFAGAAGGSSGSSAATNPSGPVLSHTEGVLQLPGGSD
jgi:hypothetical protein